MTAKDEHVAFYSSASLHYSSLDPDILPLSLESGSPSLPLRRYVPRLAQWVLPCLPMPLLPIFSKHPVSTPPLIRPLFPSACRIACLLTSYLPQLRSLKSRAASHAHQCLLSAQLNWAWQEQATQSYLLNWTWSKLHSRTVDTWSLELWDSVDLNSHKNVSVGLNLLLPGTDRGWANNMWNRKYTAKKLFKIT